MNHYIDTLLTELRPLIADLGKGGGSISPSVYDTAQVLRLYPPEDTEPAITWLLAQQQADGGWGSPEAPYAWDVPTLAAVLALHHYRQTPHTSAACDAALDFLRRQADKWSEIPIDALPTAAEMLLPYLLEEARACGLPVNPTLYATVYELRRQKLRLIGKRPLRNDLPPAHSWEALHQVVDSILPGQSGGIGLSPAATAAWLRLAAARPDLAKPSAMGQRYLNAAAAATGLNLPGVVPTIWPLTGLEVAYSLYALLITGLLMQPTLQTAINPIVDELWVMMERGHGINFGEHFSPDLDDTAVATTVLHAKARRVDPAVILQFKNGDHFCTYHHELNPSVLANAHALYSLNYTGERYPAAEEFLLKRQCADGRWIADKWHSSWIYTTLEVGLALNQLGYNTQTKKAVDLLLQEQNEDGGWGSGWRANRADTSYALISLSIFRRCGLLSQQGEMALQRGYQWLRHAQGSTIVAEESVWLAKELYTPYRLDRIYELSALISVALERIAV